MLTRFLLGVGAVLVFASLVCGQTSPAGHWEGTCTVDNQEIRLALDLAQNAKSEWIASMGVPAQNATGLVVMDVAVSGNSVKFVGVELMMAKFDLILGPNGRMKGTVSNPQFAAPIEFTRTGDAKVELIPTSPAVSKELEGDWEGSLDMSNHAFRIAVHFKNQPDKTVAATMDSLDMGMMGLPLNQVRQTGPQVEFGVKIAQSRFQGTLNKDATELTGQWTHEDSSTPFTLRKK